MPPLSPTDSVPCPSPPASGWAGRLLVPACAVVLLSLVGLVGTADWRARSHPRHVILPAQVEPVDGDAVAGAADAPVTVLALVSATCPHCTRWMREQEPLLLAGPVAAGRMRLVVRETAIDDTSLSVAALMRCVPPALRIDALAALARVPPSGPDPQRLAAAIAGADETTRADAALCAARPDRLRAAALASGRSLDAYGVAAVPAFVVGDKVRVGETPASVLDATRPGDDGRARMPPG